MNIYRHMRRMNALLRSELGEHPLYQWIHSESPEFKRAMRVIDKETGLPLWDYACPCGHNVAVHSADCTARGLVVAVPIWEWRKTVPELSDQWALCALKPPPSEHEWMRTFGTRLLYPSRGTWSLVETETHMVVMPPGQAPGQNFTMAVIRGRQRSREIPESDYNNGFDMRERKKDRDRQEMIRQRLAEALPVNPTPGTCGPVVFLTEPNKGVTN